MSDILQQDSPADAAVASRAADRDTELLSPSTQLVSDKDLYLGAATGEIGRRIADDQLELFVATHPAQAMQQLLSQRVPDYIAIHDVGTHSSARLLAAVAAAVSRKQQKLTIRRQGYGVALATLQFVELPLPAGRTLRIYTTQVDADTQSRHDLARLLLAHSRLAVVMVGELPPHALESSLRPLRDAIVSGPWPNRQMLVVPLAPAATLPAQVAALAGRSGVTVRTTPQAGRPTEAWSYISGAWNQLSGGPAPRAAASAAAPGERPAVERPPIERPPIEGPPIERPLAASVLSSSPAAHGAPMVSRPLELQPMPATPATVSVAPRPEGSTNPWQPYVERCCNIKGVVECCIFDIEQQRALAHSGQQRMAERLAAKGSMLHALMCDAAEALGLGPADPDALITLEQHYLLLRPMPDRPRIALHLVIDRHHGNIGQVRAQLHQIDQALLARPD